MHYHRAIFAFLCRDIVQRVRVIFVGLEIALSVVNADRPETVDGNVFDRQLIRRCSVVLTGSYIQIKGVLLRITALCSCRTNQVPHRIDFFLFAEHAFCVGQWGSNSILCLPAPGDRSRC
jgi:hypothetical protein